MFLWGERSGERVHPGGTQSLFSDKRADVRAALPHGKLLPSCASNYLAAHLTKAMLRCNEAVGKARGRNAGLLIWGWMHSVAEKVSAENKVFIALEEFLHYLKITHKPEACCLTLEEMSPHNTFVRAHSQFH